MRPGVPENVLITLTNTLVKCRSLLNYNYYRDTFMFRILVSIDMNPLF